MNCPRCVHYVSADGRTSHWRCDDPACVNAPDCAHKSNDPPYFVPAGAFAPLTGYECSCGIGVGWKRVDKHTGKPAEMWWNVSFD